MGSCLLTICNVAEFRTLSVYRSTAINIMKRFYLVLAIVGAIILGAVVSAKAEIVAKDTVMYEGAFRLEKIEKTNDYGEVSVRYVAVLEDVKNAKGEPRKVPTDKGTYNSDAVDALVYNVYDTGARRIAKAININSKDDEKNAQK